MLDAARAYREHGFSVVPFYARSKKPALTKGAIRPYRQRPASAAQLQQWFGGGEYNIGLVTGEVSHLLVLDVDGDDGYQSIHGLPLPETPRVVTPRGFHAYFRSDGANTMLKALPGVDLLGERFQILAPPSLHPKGPAYHWSELALQDCDLSRPPAWIRDLLQTRAPADVTHGNSTEAKKEASKYKDLSLLASSLYLLASFSVEHLQETLRRRDVNLQCAAFLGLPIEPIGRSFHCILPGHHETTPSATLAWDPKTETLKYHDWHRRSGPEWFLLAHVYAARFTGEAVWLRGPALMTWQLRLLVDASIIPPYPVRLADLPDDAPSLVKRVYHGYWHLLRCKWLYTPEASTPFTWRFAAAWCEVGERQAGEAMAWLLRYGYLRQVDTYRRTALFLPGAPECTAPVHLIRERDGIAETD